MSTYYPPSYGLNPPPSQASYGYYDQSAIGMFNVKTANECLRAASLLPVPKPLFNEFWFEGELSILYADTNVGKSILAVQICDSISKGIPLPGFKLEAAKQPVLYLDFELSDKQFENRYSNNYQDHYEFDDNFRRVVINPHNINASMPFETQLFYSIEQSIQKTQAKIVVVDNLTYLADGTEKASEASPVMKKLKELKTSYNLSMLVLAHTPKRDKGKAMTDNDLAGSRMLMNFADSSFTIGSSFQAKDIRYIKQMKQRNTERIYDENNVCVCKIIKPSNCLKFEFQGFGKEWEHLKQPAINKQELVDEMKRMAGEGKSQRDIAKQLGISAATVNTRLKEKLDPTSP